MIGYGEHSSWDIFCARRVGPLRRTDSTLKGTLRVYIRGSEGDDLASRQGEFSIVVKGNNKEGKRSGLVGTWR